MRIEYRVEGGVARFPGMNTPFILDTDALPANERSEVERLVRRVLDLPDASGEPPQGAADYRQYTITIDVNDRHQIIRANDPVENPNIQALIAFLRVRATVH